MKSFLLSFIFLLTTFSAVAQADTLLKFCSVHIPSNYISDGQVYQTPISEGESAEFSVTFYGGSTYRLAACAGLEDGNLVFTVYDRDRNELFCSADHKNTPFWDFKFSSTVDCYIEAKLAENTNITSAFAIILMGFKK